jgi:hypothetical protein
MLLKTMETYKMRIDFKDDLLAGLAKLHEHRSEFEEALEDGRLQLWNGDEVLINHWRASSLTIIVREVVASQTSGFRNMSLIIKPKPDYMYNTRTAERVEVPDRFHEEPEVDEKYYLELVHRLENKDIRCYTWDGLPIDKLWFNSGLLHKTRESAEIARKARLGL